MGCEFAVVELEQIRETVELLPNLSLNELAFTICEHLNWVTPLTRYKMESCLQLLKKLERLPPARLQALAWSPSTVLYPFKEKRFWAAFCLQSQPGHWQYGTPG